MEKERPMVSVVMITFNQEHYIDRAINGVLSQHFDYPIQLIICDDASSDNTPEHINKWYNKYPDIIDYRRNPANLGLAGNYIQAYGMVKGKYLAMCDADDYWFDKTKLQRQVNYMESHKDCALTYHRVLNYYEETGEKRLSNGGGTSNQSITAVQLARKNTITNMSVMYRADLVDLKNLPEWFKDIRLVDYAMHLLYATRGKVHYMPRPMGVYRKGSEGVWTHALAVQRLKMAFDVRLNMKHELSAYPDVVCAIQESMLDHIISMIAEGDLGLGISLIPFTGIDISIEDLKLRAEARKHSILAKKSFSSRLIGLLSRLLPLPN